MKKKQVKSAKKVSAGHIKHMGHVTDDLTMIIIASGAFIVMVLVVLFTGQTIVYHGGSPVTHAQASASR